MASQDGFQLGSRTLHITYFSQDSHLPRVSISVPSLAFDKVSGPKPHSKNYVW